VAYEHQAIKSAVLSGRADDAVALLGANYKQTAEVILQDRRIFPELLNNSEFA
jgi:DNA-binding GntR family transcriptional regulator